MLNPLVYEALHQGTRGDLEFYKARVRELIARSPQARVLELGCGAGRLTLAFAELGAEVIGVDNHPGLLSAAQHKCEASLSVDSARLKLLIRDFTTLSADDPELMGSGEERARFDLICLPYNGVYCLESEEAQVALLGSIRELLRPEGRLWIDGYALPDPLEYAYESGEEYSPLTALELGATPENAEIKRVIGVEELDRFDHVKQRLTVSYRYRAEPERASVEPLEGVIEEITHRYLYPWQLPDLCARADLTLSALYADFDASSLDVELGDTAAIRSLEWGVELESWVVELKLPD